MTMNEKPDQQAIVEEVWREFLIEGINDNEERMRQFLRILPGKPRCKNCNAPFQGFGGAVMKYIFRRRPSNMNPQMCNACDQFARTYQGGAVVELSLLFADVRGSTSLAEKMSPREFSQVINRFYNVASHVLIYSDAMIDKIIGDQVAGIYVPGFAGSGHTQRAIDAAYQLLEETGHSDPAGPWIPLGVGVHTGSAFVGSVGSSDGTMDITVLGDVPNTAARFSSSANQGEILISQPAATAAGIQTEALEKRLLDLKGKSDPVPAYVLPLQ